VQVVTEAREGAPADEAIVGSIPADQHALGVALAMRAWECSSLMDQELRQHPWVGPPPSEEYVELARGTNYFAVVLVARFLAFGVQPTSEEVAYIGSCVGRAAAELQANVTVTRAYLAWRDAACRLLREEAARLETSSAVLAGALGVVGAACDAALIEMAEAYGDQRDTMNAELEDERRLLANQTRHDVLTGLPNRLLLRERLGQAVLTGKRDGTRFALLYIDLDEFKSINDVHGHPSGDQVLQLTAQRLLHAVRRSDTIARVGGDEFVAVLPGADGDAARRIATKVRRDLRAPMVFGDLSVVVGASVGVALFPDHGESPSALLSAADDRMYRAKLARRASPLPRAR
jgi:diguanylate cyclase (GGDEF)-like protein